MKLEKPWVTRSSITRISSSAVPLPRGHSTGSDVRSAPPSSVETGTRSRLPRRSSSAMLTAPLAQRCLASNASSITSMRPGSGAAEARTAGSSVSFRAWAASPGDSPLKAWLGSASPQPSMPSASVSLSSTARVVASVPKDSLYGVTNAASISNTSAATNGAIAVIRLLPGGRGVRRGRRLARRGHRTPGAGGTPAPVDADIEVIRQDLSGGLIRMFPGRIGWPKFGAHRFRTWWCSRERIPDVRRAARV